jgi:hypothetical protein
LDLIEENNTLKGKKRAQMQKRENIEYKYSLLTKKFCRNQKERR